MAAIQRIVVIDDDSDIGELIALSADAMGVDCISTTDSETFLNSITPETTLVMLDLMMPAVDGVQLLRALGQQKCKANVALMSGVGKRVIETAEKLAQALDLNVIGYLQKPFRLRDVEELLSRLKMQASSPVLTFSPAVLIPDSELRIAIEQDQFVIYYQPQVDIQLGTAIGAEALVRWHHPERGLIYPDSFVSRLEGLNLVDQFGWIIFAHALSEVGQLADKDGVAPTLSINVAASSLRDLTFPDAVISMAAQYAIPPEGITIEITESGLVQDLSPTLEVLTRLRMKGFQLSIDDFGTGYSMMQQLQLVPATEVKIDRMFVQNMHVTNANRVMVRKTIEIGHELGMKVVAEGVETSEQLNILSSYGCDVAQGYFFSEPRPVKDMQRWFRNFVPDNGTIGELKQHVGL
jgi:EAL domain-containing protein (putative c-di-GMP-specific phosphodiesterase class I)/ActR/RegA family two-component response regulator